MATPKFTYILFIMITLSLSPLRQTQDAKQHFPTAEYEEQDLANAAKNAVRKEKQKRHNNYQLVGKNPQPWQAESLVIPEGNLNFPALPVTTSQLIVVGRVTEASAHLSENKLSVYSEFLLTLNSVLKTPSTEITENSPLTIERIGGNVRYPSGQTILYRISGWNMPKVGGEYLFFLNPTNKIDWAIVTAYELTATGVLPLDGADQFEALRGKPSPEILKEVRALISQTGAEASASTSRSRFPIVNYGEIEPTDAVRKTARQEKQKRYDGPSIVARNPNPADTEVSTIYEGPPLPALPTARSNVIVVGTVRSRAAHLSENKKNVYSEFMVQLDDVLKTEVLLQTNNILIVDREGGIVTYPNGQQILYRDSGENMPSIGKRYVFFLQYVNQDFRILTAYELASDKVVPLDDLDQFKEFDGKDTTTFLNNIKAILSKPQD